MRAETRHIPTADMSTMGGSVHTDTVDRLGIDPLTCAVSLRGVVSVLSSRI